MARVNGDELLMLLQKQRGLELLIRYERDEQKLKFYCQEFALVTAELNKRTGLETRTAEEVPVSAKKSSRSA
jgi:hypothetical protein